MEGEVAEFTYKCSEQKQQKRKRSFSVFDEENEDMIDKAFRSRLVNKLAFSHRISSELDLFQAEIDGMSGCWGDFKDEYGLDKKQNKEFLREGDTAVKQYLADALSCVKAHDSRTTTRLEEIRAAVGFGLSPVTEHQR